MIKIVILNRGWVSVGRFSKSTELDDFYTLDNAFIVRRWGTTKGLGEIAENGPTSSTILDKTPQQSFHKNAIVNTINCVTEAWAEHCK